MDGVVRERVCLPPPGSRPVRSSHVCPVGVGGCPNNPPLKPRAKRVFRYHGAGAHLSAQGDRRGWNAEGVKFDVSYVLHPGFPLLHKRSTRLSKVPLPERVYRNSLPTTTSPVIPSTPAFHWNWSLARSRTTAKWPGARMRARSFACNWRATSESLSKPPPNQPNTTFSTFPLIVC